MYRISLFLVLFCTPVLFAQKKTPTARGIIQKMTLEEKINLVVGKGMNMEGIANDAPTVGKTMDKVPGAAGTTQEYPRLKIPTTVLADGPAGLRIEPSRPNDSKTYFATAFPIATLLASTWNTDLVKEVGKAMGDECRDYGADVLLAPALNIHRNPLGGRNFEYYSEDPLVSGIMAAEMVNGIESAGVGTSIKHFAGNNQETNRNLINTIVSERALREIYLRGFEIAIKKSQPWTVMSSYNKINGTYTSQDYGLLTTILRKEWGFKGYVMTDWFGGNNAVEQMKAGNDLLMPGTEAQKKELLQAIQQKKLDEKIINENAERILQISMASHSFKEHPVSNTPSLPIHAQVAKKAASEGMVLLKNEGNTLPFPKLLKNIAAFGNTSYAFISGGTGSGDVNEAYTISLIQGLQDAGFKVDEELHGQYAKHIEEETKKQPKKKFFFDLLPPLPEFAVENTLVEAKTETADIALITIGRNSGEFQDRKIENDYYLSSAELSLIDNVSQHFHAKGKKVVVVLNVGGVVDVSAWQHKVDAILLAWQGGQEAGNAVVDILNGKVNPSGKLTTTFPVRYEDVPSLSFPGKNLSQESQKGIGGVQMGYDSEVVYNEGIFVGYRFYNTFNVPTAYEFGYGLSYTKFEYKNLKLSSSIFTNKVIVNVVVKNTGEVAGKEVVQLYVAAPAKSMDKPNEELKGFVKTKLLQPNESQVLQFELDAKSLASFSEKRSSWIAEAGNYTVKIGASSKDIRLQGKFVVNKELIAEKCHKVLLPQSKIEELKIK